MTSGAAWNTRPFRPETLQAAREAARRSGLSLGEWLNSAILDTAADAGVRACRRGLGADDLGGPDHRLADISERMDELAARIDGLMRRDQNPDWPRPAGIPSGAAPEITTPLHAMEVRLGAIVRELVPQSQAATQRLADAIQDLTSRLDRPGASSPTVAGSILDVAPDPALPRDDERAEPCDPAAELSLALAEIAARQRELDVESAGAQDFSRLEQQLRHLTEQIEMLRPAAPADVAVTEAIDRAAFERIESKIIELAQKLEAESAGAQDFSRLEQQLRHITEQIETLRNSADAAVTESIDRGAFDRIEGRIVELAQKLDASDARLDSLGLVERSLAELMFQLKETRAAAVEEADRAARAVAGEMLAESGTTGMEIDALKEELAQFRTSQAEIDRRTEDALEAVHDTLKRLVDRLATIEPGARADARPPAEQEIRVLPGPRFGSGSAAPPISPAASQPTFERHRADPDVPADHPLEPGSGAPRERVVRPAETRAAASEAVPANAAPAEPAAKANFIAAARRAAQAAAAEDADPPDPKAARSQGRGGIAAVAANRRRPLMIAAGVLLFGAGGLHLALDGHFLPPGFTASAGSGAPRAPADQTIAAPVAVKSATAAAPGESRAAPVPDPIVPESGPSAARPPSTPSGGGFLLSPVPNGSLAPPAAADSQVPEGVPARPAPPGVRSSEVTGSAPVPQAGTGATTPAGQLAARGPAPDAADKLPDGIGSAGLRSAAIAGNSAAEYEVGLRFGEGRGVPQNFEQAAHWFARAADHGLAPAQYRLGSLYEKGQGVKRDLMEARRLYIAAAQQGNAKAMHNLAVLYAVGLEAGPDYKAASEWFRKAADQGVADSQYNLAILYARGVGVEQNLAESYKWFALAAQQGDKDAGKKRDDLGARLDPQSLVAARLAVQTWTADPQPEKANKVEAPGGDWDHLPSAPAAKSKPGRRTGAAGSV